MNADSPTTATQRRPLALRLLFPTWEERKRMFAPQAWIVVIGTYAALAFIYGLPQDFRASGGTYVTLTWLALLMRTFLFHLGLFLAFIAVVAALARRWQLVLASAPLLAFLLGPAVWSLVPRRPPATTGEVITVTSANLLHANRQPESLLAEILATKADVVLLQEYTWDWHARIQSALAAIYPYSHHVCREDSFGLAIYSRRPLVESVDLAAADEREPVPQLRAVIDVAGRPVALYNIHLLPPRTLEYTTIQRQQFADLMDWLTAEKLPVVMGGDFNFTNASSFADALGLLGLADVHALSGWGRGATWPVLSFFRFLPGIRLDHVFLSRELTSPSSRTGTGTGSDHRPVVTQVGFRIGNAE